MRNFEQMFKLLEDMADEPGGLIIVRKHLGMSSEERAEAHSVQLLTDAGLAIWESDSGVRITNQGYNFLNAVKQDRPKYIAKAKELLGQGKSLLAVAAKVVSIVNGLGD